MKRVILTLYIAIIVLLAGATFIEHSAGSDIAGSYIYYSPAFCCLWGVLSLLTICALMKQRMWRRLPSFLLHTSFILILAGALITFLTSKKGYIHLRVGAADSCFVERESASVAKLPFTLCLDSFNVKLYTGTDAPADYISRITCTTAEGKKEKTVISMNKIFKKSGFRFYQSSYDDDQKGTILSVNYDPWGTAVTYIGYLLLTLSMIAVLFSRKERFHALLKEVFLKSGKPLLTILLLFFTTETFAQSKLPIISVHEADSLSATQVIYNDRVVPYNTLARDFVMKLSGRPSFGGLKPEQILRSWQKHPKEWKYVPIIKIKNAELRRRLGLSTKYARVIDLFDSQGYRLREWWKKEQNYEGKPSPLAKAIIETDEKVALIGMLYGESLARQLPEDGSVKPLSDTKIKAELLYNRMQFSKHLFIISLTLGMFSFIWMLFIHLRKDKTGKNYIQEKYINTGLQILLYIIFALHLSGYLLRWYIADRIPLSNGYETMQFMALCVLAFSCLLCRRFPFAVSFGLLLSGFTLLVSWLGEMNPQITPLMPVLMSPWLSTHVSLIMMSYAMLAFILLNGVLALCLPDDAIRLMKFSQLLLYPAVFFLGIGIFIGAVWANVSWGRYWAWDPKEVWALITFMVYGLAFHDSTLRCFRRPMFFHIYMILAFLTVLMTYFGVNFFLGGMHSYA